MRIILEDGAVLMCIDLNDIIMMVLWFTFDGVPSGVVDVIRHWPGFVDFDLLKMLHMQRLNCQRQLQQQPKQRRHHIYNLRRPRLNIGADRLSRIDL